jgi:hypothetical protein
MLRVTWRAHRADAGSASLTLSRCLQNRSTSDDRPQDALKIPVPKGRNHKLTENAASPFHAEPRHFRIILPKLRAESVIELPKHTIFRSRTVVGDELVIDRYETRKIPKPSSTREMDHVGSDSRQGVQA